MAVCNRTETSHLSFFSPFPITHELALEIAFGVYDHYQRGETQPKPPKLKNTAPAPDTKVSGAGACH